MAAIFNTADVAVVTKRDLAAEFDLEAVNRNIHTVRLGMEIFHVSSKTGEGMTQFLGYLRSRQAELRAAKLQTELGSLSSSA